jgi:hypothetical protein
MELHGRLPETSHLRILFATVYVLILRATRRCQDPISRAAPGLFLGYQGTGRIVVYKDSSNAVVDELQTAKDPGQRNPAARVLQGLPIDIPQRDALSHSILVDIGLLIVGLYPSSGCNWRPWPSICLFAALQPLLHHCHCA